MKNENKALIAYTFGHFCVDGFCIFLYCFFFNSSAEATLAAYLIYHSLAFLLQPLFGILCDRFPKWNYTLISGFLAVIALGLCGFVPYVAIVFAGIANSLFHLEGGYVSLHREKRHIGAGGLFVGGGALGVSLGRFLAVNGGNGLLPFVCFGLMAAALVFIGILFAPSESYRKRPASFGIVSDVSPAFILILTFISILIRGYAGSLCSVPGEFGGAAKGIIVSLFVLAGKMSGGYIAEKFGIRRTAALSLLLAAIAFCFPASTVMSLIGFFLMNIPMSVTLGALSDVFPENTGFAFGLAPLALFISAMLFNFSGTTEKLGGIVPILLLLVSAALMLVTLKKKETNK